MVGIREGCLDQEQIAGELKHGHYQGLVLFVPVRYKPAAFASLSGFIWVRLSVL